jgi:hypothetical protein
MLEQKSYKAPPLQSTEKSVDAAGESHLSSSDSSRVSHEVNYGLSNDQDGTESSTPGVFHRFLIWLTLLLVIVSLWQFSGLSNDVTQLKKNLDRFEGSLLWLEDNQGKYRTQAHEDVSKFQKQIEKLSRNLEHGGIYGKEMRLKVQLGQLDSQVKDLGRQLLEEKAAVTGQKPGNVQTKLNALKGKWAINLRSFEQREKTAQKMLKHLNKTGVPASITTVRVKNKIWSRIFISGFGTYEDAKRYAEDILLKRDIKTYWIRLEK